jgi:CheY-like chemotaxis protein
MRLFPGSVLLVSAEPAVAQGLFLALKRQGVATVVASDSVEAVQRLAQDAPAAIVVDLLFPDMDPEQIVHRALACRETHGSPIVALAADGADPDALLESGCNAVLSRRSPPGDLADAVVGLLRTRPA